MVGINGLKVHIPTEIESLNSYDQNVLEYHIVHLMKQGVFGDGSYMDITGAYELMELTPAGSAVLEKLISAKNNSNWKEFILSLDISSWGSFFNSLKDAMFR